MIKYLFIYLRNVYKITKSSNMRFNLIEIKNS